MLLRPLLPDHCCLALDEVQLSADGITVLVASMLPNSRCPQRSQLSGRVHSRFERTLADLPWQGISVRICWHSRKFFCDNPLCCQRIFTERLPEVAGPPCANDVSYGSRARCLGVRRPLALAQEPSGIARPRGRSARQASGSRCSGGNDLGARISDRHSRCGYSHRDTSDSCVLDR